MRCELDGGAWPWRVANSAIDTKAANIAGTDDHGWRFMRVAPSGRPKGSPLPNRSFNLHRTLNSELLNLHQTRFGTTRRAALARSCRWRRHRIDKDARPDCAVPYSPAPHLPCAAV